MKVKKKVVNETTEKAVGATTFAYTRKMSFTYSKKKNYLCYLEWFISTFRHQFTVWIPKFMIFFQSRKMLIKRLLRMRIWWVLVWSIKWLERVQRRWTWFKDWKCWQGGFGSWRTNFKTISCWNKPNAFQLTFKLTSPLV